MTKFRKPFNPILILENISPILLATNDDSMKTLLHTPLGDNSDESVRHLVHDLCSIRNRRVSDYDDYTLFNFLEVIAKEDSKILSLDHLAIPVILDQKLGTLHDTGVYSVCQELNHGDTLEAESETTLIKFLKKRIAVLGTPAKPTEPSAQEIDMRIIQQRRKNAY